MIPDHIHTVVSIPPTMSVSKTLQLLKGASSHELFKRKPHLRCKYNKGRFWNPGKFYRNVRDAALVLLLLVVCIVLFKKKNRCSGKIEKKKESFDEHDQFIKAYKNGNMNLYLTKRDIENKFLKLVYSGIDDPDYIMSKFNI